MSAHDDRSVGTLTPQKEGASITRGMGGRIAACVVALAVVLASVADNPATCHEDADAQSRSGASVPGCAGMPCQTPGIETAPALVAIPLRTAGATVAVALEEPVSADPPPPPTPPPTALA